MNFIILILIFAFFIFLPFLPGIIELLAPLDNKPLPVKMDYSRDARYFGRSFKKILKDSLKKAGFQKGTAEIKLSSGLEKIEMIYSDFNSDKKNLDRILLISGNLITGHADNFNKEIFVEGNASFGNNSIIRAAAVTKDVEIDDNSKIMRWLDANGRIRACENTYLGISATCGEEFQLSKGCKFRRLLGNPILTLKDPSSVDHGLADNGRFDINNASISTTLNEIINEDMRYDEPVLINGNLIINGNLDINSEFTINGDIKASGNITIKTLKNVNILGNIISDSIITMAGNIKVGGNIFSQEEVYLEGVDVGDINKLKSVIAKKKLNLGNNVTIYGFVLTEGIGTVV
ncbi:MAG: hypothetical protein EVJ47_00480 [Candidatus Acidulodesulfobacterium ferriphilum]|jgi:predicted acyltransferase (DUF342 family)|uniref:Polymer-forming cytoskeletal protein n=1 Tax=Candidatus Acidulodesulfobacterium ferriphilum TaxID=2597223 RepID=A0A519BBZ4_9DELT|nr:MAG: hypothetical protein EVJ47_00480 [Candidatus Acidulodesulfobacterium ferriphilum]